MEEKTAWPMSRISALVLGAVFFCVALFVSGFLVGGSKMFGKKWQTGNMPERARTLQDKQHAFFFVRPLLELEDDPELRVLDHIEQQAGEYIDGRKRGGGLAEASVYVRDLTTGAWAGVKENETYIPASISKVILMIALLRQAVTDPQLFTKKVVFQQESSTEVRDATNTSPDPLIPGELYSIDDLVRRMIIHSDNDATETLQREVNSIVLQDTFSDLGVVQKEQAGTETSISPRQYSIFFRVLYNASYLPWSISEQALQLLSKTTYKDGLVAGLPREVTLSHKFGHRETDGGKTHFLHDCGIVYAPNHPYFVCVMTRGADMDALAEIIQHISRMVYGDMMVRAAQP